MNIEKAKECCEEVVKMKNETDFTVNNYILGLAIETVLSELESLEGKLETVHTHFKRNYDIMYKMAKCLIGYTYSDEENLENIFNNEEEVIDYFTSKVVMENRSKDNTKKVEEQIK